MERLLYRAGFAVLTGLVLLLFGFTGYHAAVLHSGGGLIVLLMLVGIGYEALEEFRRVSAEPPAVTAWAKDVRVFIAVVAGALVAYTLKVHVGLGAVLAASLVALVTSLVVPGYGVPVYCGSFVGMTSSRLLVDYGELGLAAVVAGMLFLLVDRAYNGFGGKLGTVAFGGTLVTGLGLKKEFLVTPVPGWELIGAILLCSVLAAVLTYWLSVRLGHGPVVASGIVGLTGGLVLPGIYPGEVGVSLAVMVLCASFAGMSGAGRFPRWWHLLAAGLMVGAVYVYSMPLAGGAGGKLGTLAFGSVLALRGGLDLWERFGRSLPAELDITDSPTVAGKKR